MLRLRGWLNVSLVGSTALIAPPSSASSMSCWALRLRSG